MLIRERVSLFYDAALALLYPQPCAVCGASVESRIDGVACAACWNDTRIFSGAETICWKCGVETRGFISQDKRIDVKCHSCDHYWFTAARACGTYEGALRASVLSLKRESHVAPRLAHVMCEAQRREPLDSATCILPVPLHPLRERERGFNQATELGRALSVFSGLPLDESSLIRAVHTERHRAGMDSQARKDSVEGAFQVKRPRLVQNQSILLIDDVLTTGATVSECARVLKVAGALEVFVLTAARPATT